MSVDHVARLSRRQLLGIGVGGAAAAGLGLFVPDLFGPGSTRVPARAVRGQTSSGYGPLGAADANGLHLPPGFESRLIARAGQPVAGSRERFHTNPDGAGTFRTADGGWIYASNSEGTPGGVGAIRVDGRGNPADYYRICEHTAYNCSGGVTPWNTWLTCEEVPFGRVLECDPYGKRPAVARPALGLFKHEAVAADPQTRRLYMTEDIPDGRFYRFTPERWGRLDKGLLEVAGVRGDRVSWYEVPDPQGRHEELRFQVKQSTNFLRAEGIRRVGRTVYIGTTEDSKLHALDLRKQRIKVVYDGFDYKDPPLVALDQMTSSPAGELFVAEDNGRPEQGVSTFDPRDGVKRFLLFSGPIHQGSEVSGVAFNPAGDRFYFSSQRAYGRGAIYEVRGPFRRRL